MVTTWSAVSCHIHISFLVFLLELWQNLWKLNERIPDFGRHCCHYHIDQTWFCQYFLLNCIRNFVRSVLTTTTADVCSSLTQCPTKVHNVADFWTFRLNCHLDDWASPISNWCQVGYICRWCQHQKYRAHLSDECSSPSMMPHLIQNILVSWQGKLPYRALLNAN
jgi:hypothetical protein